MHWFLEVSGPEPPRVLVTLAGDRVTIGKLETNDIVLDGDVAVSRMHAVLERAGATWSIRDLGSRNGTFVRGERVNGQRLLRDGDEIRIGVTYLHVRVDVKTAVGSGPLFEASRDTLDLGRDDDEVLLAFCRQFLSGDAFTEPAAIHAVAAELSVSEDAVRQQLGRLCAKFGVEDQSDRRRIRLVHAALQRGVVDLTDRR